MATIPPPKEAAARARVAPPPSPNLAVRTSSPHVWESEGQSFAPPPFAGKRELRARAAAVEACSLRTSRSHGNVRSELRACRTVAGRHGRRGDDGPGRPAGRRRTD